MQRMLGVHGLPPLDLQLLPVETGALIAQLQRRLDEQHRQLAEHQELGQLKDYEIALLDAKLEKVNFELARLKRWKFGVPTEAMSAEQRRLFEQTLAENEASLQAALGRLLEEAAADGPSARSKLAPRARGAKRCRHTCGASSTATSPRTRPAPTRAAAAP
jgi:transposase